MQKIGDTRSSITQLQVERLTEDHEERGKAMYAHYAAGKGQRDKRSILLISWEHAGTPFFGRSKACVLNCPKFQESHEEP